MTCKPPKAGPTCLHCGQELPLEVHTVHVPAEEDPPKGVIDWTWSPRKHVRICRVWNGHYGYLGDDTFCNLACGYAWSISHS